MYVFICFCYGIADRLNQPTNNS